MIDVKYKRARLSLFCLYIEYDKMTRWHRYSRATATVNQTTFYMTDWLEYGVCNIRKAHRSMRISLLNCGLVQPCDYAPIARRSLRLRLLIRRLIRFRRLCSYRLLLLLSRLLLLLCQHRTWLWLHQHWLCQLLIWLLLHRS